MYSVVLMAALTTGAETPSWGCHGGRLGCRGAVGCNGCYGGGYGGCYGGCYGGYGCNGCWGGYRAYGGYGCYGCYGGGYACYGCNGYVGNGYSNRGIAQPVPYRPGPEQIPPPGADTKKKPAEPGKDSNPKESSLNNQAKLIVELPAEARLFIDNKSMQATGNRRVFATPSLQPGTKYYYVLRVEIIRDGQVLSDTKQVIFQAGDEIRASFATLGPPASAEKIATESEQ
jgi:uncharacterized protein (TIGR03000 family)